MLLGGIGQVVSSGHNLCRGYGDINHLYMETNTEKLMLKGLALLQVSWEFFKKEMDLVVQYRNLKYLKEKKLFFFKAVGRRQFFLTY